MLICVYIRRIKCFYCVVYLVLFTRLSYFHVVYFLSFLVCVLLLLSDFNMLDCAVGLFVTC